MEDSFTQRLKRKGTEFGFSSIGIARAELLNDEEYHLHEWLMRGYHASMQWMDRDTEKRGDATKILPMQNQSFVLHSIILHLINSPIILSLVKFQDMRGVMTTTVC